MKTSQKMEEQIRRVALELMEEIGDIDRSDEEAAGCFGAACEDQAASIGDQLMREIYRLQIARRSKCEAGDEAACCPKCQLPGALQRHRKRTLQTIRGEVEIEEPEYYCQPCRRSFFPDSAMDWS